MKTLTVSLALALAFGAATTAAAKEPKTLPPGLQKKAAQGKPLPPGWKTKLQAGQRLDDDLYAQGVVVAPEQDGIVTMRIDDEVVRLVKSTREIVDILSH